MTTLIFDLDETLIVDKEVTELAFKATAADLFDDNSRADRLRSAINLHANKLFQASDFFEYCQSIGISYVEALWFPFAKQDSDPRMNGLISWVAGYRIQAWSNALAELGIDDQSIAIRSEEKFCLERRSRQKNFENSDTVLSTLSKNFKMGLLTNGASCLQRQKVEDSGLSKYFQSIVVSSEVGVGKPDSALFSYILSDLKVEAKDAIMIGDNRDRDIKGAVAAGMRAIWINRDDKPNDKMTEVGCMEINSLLLLPDLLKTHLA